MAMPSAAEVNEALQHCLQLRQKLLLANMATNREQEEASVVYDETLKLAIEIYDTVEFKHRNDPDPASRRAKCEKWGVVYVYAPGEEQPAPTPTPTPTTTSTPVTSPSTNP